MRFRPCNETKLGKVGKMFSNQGPLIHRKGKSGVAVKGGQNQNQNE